MIRYVFAMHVPAWGRALNLPRTLDELAVAGFAGATRGPSGAPSEGQVAITFDDGPHPEGTPKMIDALAEFDAKATFFVVGEQVVKRPELARRIVAAGHAIGLHGYVHRPHTLRSAKELADDLERGLAAIEDAAGIRPLLHRPPYGIYSPASLRMAREHELQPLLWSKWGKDWRKVATPEQITRRVITRLQAGDVILLHDADYYSARRSHRRTAAALPEIMKTLKSAGFGTVTFA
ncbi:MAG TPA: polysaccharide deacetylase family protein [Solirubrobacteraceae bacterium]|jgi:peptidoglycan/xylan/chitin deacetylase (PgdA/CDA1 family)|nr:polysaccharide deacetylase family protein [Solirubrobacteraceae bacterium]